MAVRSSKPSHPFPSFSSSSSPTSNCDSCPLLNAASSAGLGEVESAPAWLVGDDGDADCAANGSGAASAAAAVALEEAVGPESPLVSDWPKGPWASCRAHNALRWCVQIAMRAAGPSRMGLRALQSQVSLRARGCPAWHVMRTCDVHFTLTLQGATMRKAIDAASGSGSASASRAGPCCGWSAVLQQRPSPKRKESNGSSLESVYHLGYAAVAVISQGLCQGWPETGHPYILYMPIKIHAQSPGLQQERYHGEADRKETTQK